MEGLGMYFIKNIYNAIIKSQLSKALYTGISIHEIKNAKQKKEQTICEAREIIRMNQYSLFL